MFEIHTPSFIFGAFSCACMVIAYIFGKLAMGDGECGEFEEDNEADEYFDYYSEEVRGE